MAKIYLFLFFLIFSVIQAQIVNIPDNNFKAKLLSASTTNNIATNISNQSIIIDTNADNEIQISEIINVYKLNLNGQTSYPISDLTGINQFSNLRSLSATNNTFTNLQLGNLIYLQLLNLTNNQLSSLSVSNLTALTNVTITNNLISNLSILNCTNLQFLNCSGNQLTSIDNSGFTNLINLDCSNNQLTTMTLNNNTGLLGIIANGNQLSAINLLQAPNLINIYLHNNLFFTIDAGQLTKLDNFNFSNNPNLISFNIKNGRNNYTQGATPFFSNTPNLTYICADDIEMGNLNALLNYYNQPNVVMNSYCSFTPGGTFYTLQGNTKYDLNNDGCDVNDLNKALQKFTATGVTGTGYIVANNSGNYSIPVQAGLHTITPVLENPTYFNISPASLTANFPSMSSPLTQNFCLTANGNHNDLEVLIIPITAAAPGFNAKYKIVYKNKGTASQSGTVVYNFNDNLMNLLTSTVAPNSQSTGVLNWNFANLLPFESREITVTFTLNTPTQNPPLLGGNILNYSAQVIGATDETPTDNLFTLNQTVVNSFDPNDKTCLEGSVISSSQVGNYVHYLIRFENTGTANAQNIVVKDEIDLSKFDLSTLVPMNGSHNFVTRITGSNTVEFIFENIQLPFLDATNDGYVTFKIKTKANLAIGNTFSNTAKIYFDYNAPIITNTYATTVQNILGTSELDSDTAEISIYPNPVKDVLHFKSKDKIMKAEIYDSAGRILSSVGINNDSVNVSELAKGNYLIKFSAKKQTIIRKFIKN